MQKATVKQVKFPKEKRIIVISDIHGHLQNFQKLLHKIHFSKDDILIIDGDILEKGPQPLATLRFIMQLAKQNTVYSVLGNNDWIWEELEEESSNQELFAYMKNRNSIFNDMCRELNVKAEQESDLSEIKKKLKTSFKKEWDYLKSLPDILESEHYLFVHAGLESEDLQQQQRIKCIKNDWFFSQEISFSRWCVVGHFPTCLYGTEKMDFNVRIDRKRKLISIDGGCVVKNAGQLNALIIPQDGSEAFLWESADSFPQGIAEQPQLETDASCIIDWPDNEVRILREDGEFSLCKAKKNDIELWIPSSFLYQWQEKIYTDAITDHCLPISAGDIVSIVERTQRGILIKKDGIMGWYTGTIRELG